MKLIIDIPKEEYEEFKKSVTFLQSISIDFSKMRQYMLAIANGTILEQEPTTKIEESNFSQEQYLVDIQSAYDCGKSVIDKIRAEIKDYFSITCDGNCDNCNRVVKNPCGESVDGAWVLHIIDKYKAESEVEDGNDD